MREVSPDESIKQRLHLNVDQSVQMTAILRCQNVEDRQVTQNNLHSQQQRTS